MIPQLAGLDAACLLQGARLRVVDDADDAIMKIDRHAMPLLLARARSPRVAAAFHQFIARKGERRAATADV